MRVVIKEAGVEYMKEDAPTIRTPADVAEQLIEFNDSETEQFIVMVVNARNKLIVAEVVTSGLADASLVHSREVFRTAVRVNGHGIVLAHNHPSGDVSPSAEDIRITKQMVEAGGIIEIKVLDHVIIGKGKHLSLREEGLVKF